MLVPSPWAMIVSGQTAENAALILSKQSINSREQKAWIELMELALARSRGMQGDSCLQLSNNVNFESLEEVMTSRILVALDFRIR